MLKDEEQTIEKKVVIKKKQIYIPERELRREVIQLHHDIPVERHSRKQKTIELVTRNYQQPGVTKKVGKYMDGYDTCQHYKNRSEAPVEKLIPNAILEKLWSHILADFITKLSLVQGYDIVLVVCNCFTKIVYFIATMEKTLAEELAKLFRDHVWKLHSFPESIILDRGVQFAAEIIRELNKLLEIQTKLSIAYHSQIDRQMEKINQELEQYLRVFINYKQKQQLDQLETTKFVYNNKIHLATKVSPPKANYSQDP